jgi:hypothetical protein
MSCLFVRPCANVCSALYRLLEFQDTPTSGLTKEEFEVVDLDEERDPPAFARNRAAEGTAAVTASVPASPAPSAAAEEDLAQELQAHLAAPDTLRAEQEVSRALADPLLAKALAQPVDSNDFSDIPDDEIGSRRRMVLLLWLTSLARPIHPQQGGGGDQDQALGVDEQGLPGSAGAEAER